MKLKNSELILNDDGSVYHLNLLPEHIAPTVITMGDQDRISRITQHFETIEFSIQKREFATQTGCYKGKRITVLSTGIGADNIDIVLNELDALVNIDLKTRTIKENPTPLNIIRIGTSGALQPDIEVDSFLMSRYAIGLDNMLRSYSDTEKITEKNIEKAFVKQTDWDLKKGLPYVVQCSENLAKQFESERIINGFTATAGGFYAPQGRSLRLQAQDTEQNTKFAQFSFENLRLTNLEMETAAIYGLGKLLGHNCLSFNAILANRANGTFSRNPKKTIDNLIAFVLEKIIDF